MQRFHVLGALLATATLLQAQGPCSPPSSLSTLVPFQASHYLGSPMNPTQYNGVAHFADLTVASNVVVTQMAVNLYETGNPNPNQIGLQAQALIYTCATTWGPNRNELLCPPNPPAPLPAQNCTSPGMPGAPWTFVGDGLVTIATINQPSVITLSSPIPFAAGQYGLCVQVLPGPMGPVHPLVVLQSAVPAVPLTASNQFLTIANQGVTRDAFNGGAIGNLAINLSIDYTISNTTAFFNEFGRGCYDLHQNFYEAFDVPPGTIDLGNFGINMTPTSNVQYVVTANPQAVIAPNSPSLTLVAPGVTTTGAGSPTEWDDALTVPQPLPFAWNYPDPSGTNGQGTTNQILIGSNGYVLPDVTSMDASPFYNRYNLWFDGVVKFAALWGDLDPSAGGTMHMETHGTAPNRMVVITWQGVPEWNVPTAVNTAQMIIHEAQPGSNNQVEYRWGGVAISAAPILVGFTVGQGTGDNGSQDLFEPTRTPPFIVFRTGDGSGPLRLTADARPVTGTTINLQLADVRAGSTLGILAYGVTAQTPPLPLDPFGIPRCSLHINPAFLLFGGIPISGGAPLAIPASPALNGLGALFQAAVLNTTISQQVPGNAIGLMVSNGICLRVGTN